MSDIQTGEISTEDLENLEKKKLGELQTLAKSLGVKRVTGIRKQALIDQIKIHAGQATMNREAEKKVAPKQVTSQKEDELTSYGGQSHIVSYKKEEPKKQENQNGK